jgi:hypothetical protein
MQTDVLRILKELSDDTTPGDVLGGYAMCTAVELKADRVSLPKQPGRIPLTRHMPLDEAVAFNDPRVMLRPANEIPVHAATRSRAKVVGEQSEYVKLVNRCIGLGMWTLYDDSGRRGPPPVINGVFVVRKDTESDRLIINAKPANCYFAKPRPVNLPTPDVLAELALEQVTGPNGAQQPLYVAKTDLSDFYHSLLLPEWMTDYFCLPAIRIGDLHGRDPSDNTLVYPKCLSLPMGWSHSVIAAQIVHEFIIQRAGLLTIAPPLSRLNDNTVRDGRERSQTYIDDFIVYGTDPLRVGRVQTLHSDAVTDAGFVVKASKSVKPQCTPPVKCVGVSVDGVQLRAGVDASELEELRQQTLAFLRARVVTGRELSRIVGAWVWAVSVRRPALAVFNSVYTFMRRYDQLHTRLWPSVRRELRQITALAPFLNVSIRRRHCKHMVCTDASTDGFGAAIVHDNVQHIADLELATVSGAMVNVLAAARGDGQSADIARGTLHAAMLRAEALAIVQPRITTPPHTLARVEPANALSLIPTHALRWINSALPCLLPVSNRLGESLPAGYRLMYSSGGFRVVYDALARMDWRVSVSGRWRQPNGEHINARELRAVLYGLRDSVARGCKPDERLLLFVDSLVALGALHKGRTSSFVLLRRVRQVTALVLATGIRPVYRYIETDWNPSDAPSRFVEAIGSPCARQPPNTHPPIARAHTSVWH